MDSLSAAASRQEVDGEKMHTSTSAGTNNDSRRAFLQHGTAASVFAGGALFPSTQPAVAAAAPNPTGISTGKKSLTDVKVALWGFGNQNKLMAKYLHERHVPIVTVISHHDIGQDYTTVDLGRWGKPLGGKRGVKIVGEDEAKATLLTTQPDICIVCTRCSLQDIQASLRVCAESKVNVVTIAEELLNSRITSPAETKELDALFRQNGVTLTGSGFEDVACCEMVMAMSSLMHRIEMVEGLDQWNLDDYGKVLAEEYGVGLTPAQFQKNIVENPKAQSYVLSVGEWFVSRMGLTLKESKEERVPTFASHPLYSTAMERELPVGQCTGMKAIATTATKEGVSIKIQFIGKIYEPNDFDQSKWGFLGEPSGVEFTMARAPTVEMTDTAVISRILQVLDAPAGYVTSDKLPGMARQYQHWT